MSGPVSLTLPALPAAGDPAVNHPLVQGYLCELPPVGSHLDRDERIALERLNHEMLNILYHPDHAVQVGVVTPPAASSSTSSNGNGTATAPAATDPSAAASTPSTDTSSAASIDPSSTAAAASS